MLSRAGQSLADGRWVTIEHEHVYIKGGKIVAGPDNLIGKNPAEISLHETPSKELKHHDSECVLSRMAEIKKKHEDQNNKLTERANKLATEVGKHYDELNDLRTLHGAKNVFEKHMLPEYALRKHENIKRTISRKVKEVDKIQKEITGSEDAKRAEALQEVIGNNKPMTKESAHVMVTDSNIHDEQSKQIQEAADDFRKMMGGHGVVYYPTINVRRPDETLENGAYKDRSYHSGGHIYIAPNAGKATVVHELGHAMEHYEPEILASSADFLKRRTAGKPLQKLKDMTGNAFYKDDEIAKEGGFVDPYVGKHYTRPAHSYTWNEAKKDYDVAPIGDKHLASEVVSMGLEHMYKDPIGFAKADPDHFKLIHAVMHRHDKTGGSNG